MSCFIVPDAHVSAIAAFAIHNEVCLDDAPGAIAQSFADANRAAYSERYHSPHPDEVAQYRGLDRTADAGLAPVAIVKACDCLDYQCSDWTGWTDSPAARHLRAIRRVAAALADPYNSARDTCRELSGYEAAAWVLEGAAA